MGALQILEAVGQGLGLGLGLAFAIGPVFFALVDTAITRGLREGIKFVAGIAGSDFLYALALFLGSGQLLSSPQTHRYLSIGGGIVLIVLGLGSVLRTSHKGVAASAERGGAAAAGPEPRSTFGSLIKGFALNSINPGTPVIWLAATSAGGRHAALGGQGLQAIFLLSILVTVIGTDITKAYVALRLRTYLSPARLVLVNRVAGSIMVVAGVWLLVSMLR